MTGPKQSDELAAVEAEHGFTFGRPKNIDHQDDGAPTSAALICSTPGCAAQNRIVQIHTDTILPVFCGECGTVLYCDHQWEPITTVSGTLSAPFRTEYPYCPICGTKGPETTTPTPPVDIGDIPIQILAALLNSPLDNLPTTD